MKTISVCAVAILLVSLASAADYNEQCVGVCSGHVDKTETIAVQPGLFKKSAIDRYVQHRVEVSPLCLCRIK